MKKYAAYAMLICMLGLVACGNKDGAVYNNGFVVGNSTPASNKADSTSNGSEAPQKKTEDQVFVFASEDIEIVDTFGGSMYSIYSKLQEDGSKLYGVIGTDGNIYYYAQSEYLGWCDWHEVLFGDTPGNIFPYEIAENYRIDDICAHGGGIHWGYILDCKTNKMYSLSSSEGGLGLYEPETVTIYSPYIKYNGDAPLEFDEEYYSNVTYDIPEYEYDYYENVADANYYYFLADLANQEFECEFKNEHDQAISLGKCSIWYSDFTNDYLIISRNGKYGFVDKNGKDASMFIYEDAEEACDGKAWVKLDGKWRVINLG